MELQSIVCPNCGATTTKKDYCEFCGSFLVGKLSNGVDVNRYADTVRKMPLDNGIKKMLEIFINLVNNINDKYCELLVLEIINIKAKGLYEDATILTISTSKEGLILRYPGEASYKFANSSMFTLFERKTNNQYVVSFGKDINGAVKFINQFIKELYPKADVAFWITIISPDDKYQNKLGRARYNRNGSYIDGVFNKDIDLSIPEKDLTESEFNYSSIEEIIKAKENFINLPKELTHKLEKKLQDKNFVQCINNLRFRMTNSIDVSFSHSDNAIYLKFWGGDKEDEFKRLGSIRPYIEKTWCLKAMDLKEISEDSTQYGTTLAVLKSYETEYIYSERLKQLLNTIWLVVESPTDEVEKLQRICAEIKEYEINYEKLHEKLHALHEELSAWQTRSGIIWGIGIFLTFVIGGIWSFIILNWSPLIWFAVVTIVLGILCFIKTKGLESTIKACESQYWKTWSKMSDVHYGRLELP